MTAVDVERPLTAQERVLTANNPPPRVLIKEDIGHRRRAAANCRGQSIAALFLGDVPAASSHHAEGKEHHVCPSDFLAGPKEPGHIKRGVRRFEDKNECIVAKALTEEWITGRKDGEVFQRQYYKQRGPKDNLDGMSCRVKTEEAKQRKMRAPGSAPPHNTQAPYCEPELGPFTVEKPRPEGKRRFAFRSSSDNVAFGTMRATTPQPQRVHTRRNRANESVDVLNLGQYTCKQLNEHERKIMLGPREIIPCPLPPRQRSIIARVKTHANETHDVLGTGFGVKEAEVVHRKNPGLSAPRRCNAVNIFEYARDERPDRSHKVITISEYGVEQTGEGSASRQRQPLKKVELGLLFESKSPDVNVRTGRSRGVYAPRGSTNNLLL